MGSSEDQSHLLFQSESLPHAAVSRASSRPFSAASGGAAGLNAALAAQERGLRALVLALGLYMPPYLADWYRMAARLIG